LVESIKFKQIEWLHIFIKKTQIFRRIGIHKRIISKNITMLNEAFLHFPQIGKKNLEKLNNLGIHNWNDFSTKQNIIPFSKEKITTILELINKFNKAIELKNFPFLIQNLHPKDKWRILYDYFEDASFFDIETDGYYNRITTISCLHKNSIYTFTRFKNLDDFLDLLLDIKYIVSFNGSSFDVPVVLQNFHLKDFPCPHIDLRWVAYHEGLKGGLKSIEQKYNINRPFELEGVDGLEAIELWLRWIEWKDKNSYMKLIKYCAADSISLRILTARIINNITRNKIHLNEQEHWKLLNDLSFP
jgi:uncharacterized protein